MLYNKQVKDSEYFPVGVRRLNDGLLFVDTEKIKSFELMNDHIKIEYWDKSYLQWRPILENKIIQ